MQSVTPADAQRLIKTLPRKGLRFVGTVREVQQPITAPPRLPSEQPVPFALPDQPSIAVLPFANMSGDPEQEYFADGMVEEIITGLSRMRWLFVIAAIPVLPIRAEPLTCDRSGVSLECATCLKAAYGRPTTGC